MYRWQFIAFIFILAGFTLTAQEAPSLEASPDSSIVLEPIKVKPEWPNPRKTLLWSLVPGGGQMYNKRWWKVPLVYGAFGGIFYAIDYNQSRYRRLRDALELKRAGEEHEFSGTSIDDLSSLRSLRDQFDKNTQVSYIGIVLVYGLQTLEAYVDSHLMNFDVNDDIGIRLKPSIEATPLPSGPALGIGIQLQLGRSQRFAK